MSSFPRRLLVSSGTGAFVYGNLAAAGNYKILHQCFELAASGEKVASCGNMPDTLDLDLGLVTLGFIIVVAFSGDIGWLSNARKRFLKKNETT